MLVSNIRCIPIDNVQCKITLLDMIGVKKEFSLPISFEEFNSCYTKWEHGDTIQGAFPNLNSSQREYLISGLSPSEWDELMAVDSEQL